MKKALLFTLILFATGCTTTKNVSYYDNGNIRDLFMEKSNGKVVYKRYYENGEVAEMFTGNGNLKYKQYYENGKLKEKWVRKADRSIDFASFDKKGVLQRIVSGYRMFTNRIIGPGGESNITEIITNPEPDQIF